MQAEVSDRDDVLMTLSIEMQRMFTVLSDFYSGPEQKERLLLLNKTETKLKSCIESLRVRFDKRN